MNPKPPRTRRKSDIAILQGPTEDGLGARVVRVKDGMVSAGEVRPAREGEPLSQRELVRLKPLHAELPICEVEVLHAAPEPEPSEKPGTGKLTPGPARVATDTYRKNWSTVFGAKRKRGDYSVN